MIEPILIDETDDFKLENSGWVAGGVNWDPDVRVSISPAAVRLMHGMVSGGADWPGTGTEETVDLSCCLGVESVETVEELGAELLTTGDFCVTTLENGDVLLLGVGKVTALGARELEASVGARLGARLGLALSVVVVPGAEGVFQVLRS
jgi:hypothetical protein